MAQTGAVHSQTEPAPGALADHRPGLLDQAIEGGAQLRPIGVTRQGTALESVVVEAKPWPPFRR